MTYKEFNYEEHMSCPRCGFEVVYAKGTKAAYVYKSGVVDSKSMTNHNDYCDGEKLMCNSIHCDWEMSF
jgi:hypothetical protein